MAKSRLEEVNNDLVSLIVENKNEIVKLQRAVGGKAPIKHEEEGITILQTKLETTGNEVKTNTAEKNKNC